MNPIPLTPRVRAALLLIAAAGAVWPNGWFLWLAVTDFAALLAAMRQPVTQMLLIEATGLMALLAWLIHRSRQRPGWPVFILLSLAGSLLCSVPLWLWLASRRTRRTTHASV